MSGSSAGNYVAETPSASDEDRALDEAGRLAACGRSSRCRWPRPLRGRSGPRSPRKAVRLEYQTENARISGVRLGFDRDIFLSFWVTVEGKGWGQSIGGYVLAKKGETEGFAKGFVAIANLLNVVGVESWEELRGQLIRVKDVGGPGSSTPPIIGNIIDDEWWDIRTELAT